jgi:hypothetical protein
MPSVEGYVRESFERHVITDRRIFEETGVQPGLIWNVENMREYQKTLEEKMKEELFAGNRPGRLQYA